MVFINLSNHSSKKWNEKQKKNAEQFGPIIDLPFPAIDPYGTSLEIDRLVQSYYEKIAAYDNPVVMVQGEFIFTFRLVTKLKANGIKTVASCSERRTIEYIDDNGFTARKSEFEFVNFKEY